MKKSYAVLSAFVVFSVVGYMTLGSASGNGGYHGQNELWSATRVIQNALNSMQKSINDLVKAVNNGSNGVKSVAAPAWSQALPAVERFLAVLGGGAVLDNETKLVWERSPALGVQDWASANVYCVQKAVGNRKGWRLPSVQELASLVEPNQVSPSLPVGQPFNNVQLSEYWTASTGAFNDSFAGVVSFGNGDVSFVDKDDSRSVWCVRGGVETY